MKEVLYEVRCLKSTEDMILALAGQFKQLSNEPEKFIAEVMGSNPVESPEFFRFMRQLLKLSSKCEDHVFSCFLDDNKRSSSENLRMRRRNIWKTGKQKVEPVSSTSRRVARAAYRDEYPRHFGSRIL